MSVTRKDIAKHTGLSPSTVGMILSGRGERYSDATRKSVLSAAEELNYRVDPAARSLRLNRSFLLGVLMSAGNAIIVTDVLRGIQDALGEGDYAPTVFSHRDGREQAECLRRCVDRRVDGLIANVAVDSDGKIDRARYEALASHPIPVVEIFGRFLADTIKINVDFQAAGRMATEHLLALGHRRIAMFTHAKYRTSASRGAGRHFDAWERYLGYEQALRTAGLEPIVVTHPLSGEVDVEEEFFSGGHQGLGELLNHPAQPTAVVCYNDLQAYGLIRAARVESVPLPERLSIVGYGDKDVSRITTPALTTLRIPAFEVGHHAAATLLRLIDNRPCDDQLIASRLIVRESTCSFTS